MNSFQWITGVQLISNSSQPESREAAAVEGSSNSSNGKTQFDCDGTYQWSHRLRLAVVKPNIENLINFSPRLIYSRARSSVSIGDRARTGARVNGVARQTEVEAPHTNSLACLLVLLWRQCFVALINAPVVQYDIRKPELVGRHTEYPQLIVVVRIPANSLVDPALQSTAQHNTCVVYILRRISAFRTFVVWSAHMENRAVRWSGKRKILLCTGQKQFGCRNASSLCLTFTPGSE